MAILMISLSWIPVERFCFRRKNLPASSIALLGTNPTSSEPVALIPRASAALALSSNARCKGVSVILVMFMVT